MPTFLRDGATISYTDSGAPVRRPEAPTIVFGHGMLFGGWMFRAQVAALSADFRCVTIDWRGQGDTPASIDGYDMDSLTDDVAVLVEQLGVAPVHYVGLSMGGFVGMRLAARHPGLVRSLSLLSTSAELDDDEGNVRSAQLAGMLWAFGTARVRETLEPMAFGSRFRGASDNKPTIDEWLSRVDRCDGRGIASAMMGVILREPVAAELSRIVAPTLVIHGEDDGMPLACGQAIAAAIPGAQFHALPDCGHACTLEKPDEVTSLLGTFLAQQSRQGDGND